MGLNSSSKDQFPELKAVPVVFNVGNGRVDEPNEKAPSVIFNVIADELFKNKENKELMKKILIWSDVVTVLTAREDEILSKNYISSMPTDWKFFVNDKFERYNICGIETPPSIEIDVYGAVSR